MFNFRYSLICLLTSLISLPAMANVCFLPDNAGGCDASSVSLNCSPPSDCIKCLHPKEGAHPCASASSACPTLYKSNECCEGDICPNGRYCSDPLPCVSGGIEYCSGECLCDTSIYRYEGGENYNRENCTGSCTDSTGTYYEDCGEDPAPSGLQCECGYADSTHETCLEYSYKYQNGTVPSYMQLLDSITHTSSLGSYVCSNDACCAVGYWDPSEYLPTSSTAAAYCNQLQYTSTSCTGNFIACPFDASLKKCLNYNR